ASACRPNRKSILTGQPDCALRYRGCRLRFAAQGVCARQEVKRIAYAVRVSQLLGLRNGSMPESQAPADISKQYRCERKEGLRGRFHIRYEHCCGRTVGARPIEVEHIAVVIASGVQFADQEQRHAECTMANQLLRYISFAIFSQQELFTNLSGLL